MLEVSELSHRAKSTLYYLSTDWIVPPAVPAPGPHLSGFLCLSLSLPHTHALYHVHHWSIEALGTSIDLHAIRPTHEERPKQAREAAALAGFTAPQPWLSLFICGRLTGFVSVPLFRIGPRWTQAMLSNLALCQRLPLSHTSFSAITNGSSYQIPNPMVPMSRS